MLQKARAFAISSHGDQKYGDHPYVFHLDAVAKLAEPYGEDATIVAYGHREAVQNNPSPASVRRAGREQGTTMVSTRLRRVAVGIAVASLAVCAGGCGGGSTTPPPLVNSLASADMAALREAAAELDRVSDALRSAIFLVDSMAGEIATHMQGPAGAAAQESFQLFRYRATRQVELFNIMRTELNQAGLQFPVAANGTSTMASQYSREAINGQVAEIQVLLDEGGRTIKKLATVWGGAGADAYYQVQERWDRTAAELNASLIDLASKIN